MNKLNHVAFIMDGNRRWAKEQNLPSSEGHKAGAKKAEEVVEEAAPQTIDDAQAAASEEGKTE